MPILGPSAQACFDSYEPHLRRVVGAVLGDKAQHQLATLSRENKRQLTFRSGEMRVPVRVETSIGPLFLWAQQELAAEKQEGASRNERYRLRAHAYSYRLAEGDSFRAAPVLRWEYTKQPSNDYCRGHVHVHAERNGESMERQHIATGYVLIEHVLRFLVTDLGSQPDCPDWDRVLRQSEDRYWSEFTY